jgi:sodium-dependent dicarboxylate transporter 2/3/5
MRFPAVSVRRLRWRPPVLPSRIHQFIYSKRNLALALLSAALAYVVLAGQPELARRALTVFVFAAACWLLEVFPYPITGLMVPVACALLGVLGPAQAFSPFAREVIFIFIGGLVLAGAIGKFRLDRRIALYILQRSRGGIDGMLLAFMLMVGFLSFWMSTTVIVLVLLPSVLTVIASLPRDQPNIARKLLLGLTMAACIGGIGMLTGTPPNLIAADALSGHGGFSFVRWAYYGVPVALISLVASYIVLVVLFPTPNVVLDLRSVEKQAREIGPLSGDQKKTLAIFGATVVLFLSGESFERALGLAPSLSSAAIVSVLGVLMLFGAGLLRLEELRGMRFDLIFLIGGGLVLGQALHESGAAGILAGAIRSVGGGLPVPVLLLALAGITVALTNFMSNTATAGIMVPIALETATGMGLDPVGAVIVVGMASSIAYVTPVGTPSTAIVFSTGALDKKDLFRAGALSGFLVMVIIVMFLAYVPPWGGP